MNNRATKIYINGNIITVNANNELAEAIAVDHDMIIAVGSTKSILAYADDYTEVVDLAGKTVLPGFIDPHSHVYNNALRVVTEANLNSPPIGKITCIDDILNVLRERVAQTPKGTLVKGFGYDDSALKEKRRVTRYDLDKVSTEHPIIIRQISGHINSCNSKGLELLGITEDTPNPEGGVFCRDEQTGEHNGVIQGYSNVMHKILGIITPEEEEKVIAAANDIYAQQGITLASTGSTRTKREVDLFRNGIENGTYQLRVILNRITWLVDELEDCKYDHFLLKGSVKNFYDGSIQGYTGYLSKPYYVPFNGDKEYCGYPVMKKEELIELVKIMHDRGEQVFMHCNGDQAIEDMIDAIAIAQKENPRRDPRHVIIHAQMAREDQLDRMKSLGIIPSFFILHTYYWGDRHRTIFMGPNRANRMSPLKSSLDRDIIFTIHCDTPVVPQEPLKAIWSAVNRLSTSGQVIGAEECISVTEAIRAHTYNAAYQYFLEDVVGSIEANKWADLTILGENPLSCDKASIKDIEVLETIVAGKTVYKK